MLAWFRNLRLRWKILMAPAFLMLVLAGLSGFAIYQLRANQETVDTLMVGPIRQAEVVADFSIAIWSAQARLYNLSATAANESDQKKIKAVAEKAADVLKQVPDKLAAFETLKASEQTVKIVAQLKTAVGKYMKAAKNVIDMWDDPGSALMFVVTAERSFAEIEKLTDGLTEVSNEVRDREVAVFNLWLAKQLQLLPAIVLATILIGSLVSGLVSLGIVRSVRKMVDVIKSIAAGNFNVVVPATDQRDEIGVIAGAVQVFKDNMMANEELRASQSQAEARNAAERKADIHKMADEFEKAVGAVIETVSSASTELEAAAATLSSTAETTQDLAGRVAFASEEASTNVQSVASATEELGGSIAEIGRQVQESSRIASDAVKQAATTDNRIGELSQAADRIGNVLTLITTIAEQTNLLALNATIEAARAGDAGKGFAVVASEVKTLATQTAKATDEIRNQISAMQMATQDSVAAIKGISATIVRVSEITSTIAAAVEEQGAATQEISRNVQRAAHGTAQVATSITEVTRGAGETGSASANVLSSAHSLAGESNHLKSEVGKFLATVRAA